MASFMERFCDFEYYLFLAKIRHFAFEYGPFVFVTVLPPIGLLALYSIATLGFRLVRFFAGPVVAFVVISVCTALPAYFLIWLLRTVTIPDLKILYRDWQLYRAGRKDREVIERQLRAAYTGSFDRVDSRRFPANLEDCDRLGLDPSEFFTREEIARMVREEQGN